MMEDHEILDLYRTKSTRDQAFSVLLDKYQERVYWHIRKIVLHHEDANDVVQNTFIKVWKGLDGFKSQSKLYTWMYRIATNESLTFLKKKSKRQTSNLSSSTDQQILNLKSDPYVDGSEIELKLQTAIARLPEKQRLVFNMRYFDEMKYEDMSEVLETSVGALKASYHHAVKKIELDLKSSMD